MASVAERVQRLGLGVHQWLYEHTDGRVGERLGPVRNLLLRTTGRRTGQPRTSALVYAADGPDRFVVVGSNGGADRAPGWVHNVRAQPSVEIQVGRRRMPATATAIEPGSEEYSRLWKLVNENNRYRGGGRYDHYQSLTDRPIPLVVCATSDRGVRRGDLPPGG